jgi:hypothetical protein
LIQTASVDPQTNIQTNQLGTPQNVGLILGVTPRVADDGRVAMEIDVEKSEVGPEAEGIPISVLTTGDVIRSPRINTTTASTTVSALTGQTIVLGGLITSNKSVLHRRVPLLASIPILGHLFRYDSEIQRKTELLIILTPRVIWDEEDAELIKQIESARISWVLSDVHKIHGVHGLRTRWQSLDCKDIPVIYPDQDPHGMMFEEEMRVEDVPAPDESLMPGPAPPAKPGKATLGPMNAPGAPGGLQRPPSSYPPAGPPGARQYHQPPGAPPRLPTMEGGPTIAPPHSAAGMRPLHTAMPPAGPPPLAPPQGTTMRMPAGYGQPQWQAPGPGNGVQPAGYQAVYPVHPGAGAAQWPPRAVAPPTPPPASARPGVPLPYNPAVPPSPAGHQTQAAAEYRPWGPS